jgi:hypothetical protein
VEAAMADLERDRRRRVHREAGTRASRGSGSRCRAGPDPARGRGTRRPRA